MSFKTLVVRWILAAVGLFILAFSYVCIWKNAVPIATWIAPPYVGLSEEEMFKRSKIPCIRPAGAKNGCTYPEVQKTEPTGDEWRDRQNAKLTELTQFNADIAIQGPEYLHHHEYFEREVVPRRDRLTLWTAILFGLAAIGIVLYAFGSTRAWWRTSAATDMARVKRKLFQPKWIARVRGMATSRQLRRLDSDFQALHRLHQNGMISDEQFEQRKEALRVSIDMS